MPHSVFNVPRKKKKVADIDLSPNVGIFTKIGWKDAA
jgi:hypothetical protein